MLRVLIATLVLSVTFALARQPNTTAAGLMIDAAVGPPWEWFGLANGTMPS